MLASLLLLPIIFVFLCLAVYHLYAFHGRKARLINELPGPPCLPVIGNLHLMNLDLLGLDKLARLCSDQFYPAYRIWLGHKAIISIRHPDDLEVLLTNSKELHKGYGYEPFVPWLKRGLVTSDGEKWHGRRKILAPAFYLSILKKYLETMNEHGETFMTMIKARGDTVVQDLFPYCSGYALDIICEAAMGVSLHDKDMERLSPKYKEAVQRISRIVIRRLTKPYIRDWMIPFIPYVGELYKTTLEDLEAFPNKIIEDRRKYHMSTEFKELAHVCGEDLTVNCDIGTRKNRLAILDLLLLAEQRGLIDDEGIKEEVATLVLGGHDAPSIAMLFSIMLLAENEDAQDRARKEVEEIWGECGGKPEMSHLQQLNFLERCIKESMRLFPPIQRIERTLMEDLHFKNFVAPEGTSIAICFVDVHKDPNFWPDPEKFDPDRFLPERSRDRHPFAFLPFSAGLRSCIGQKFAMMELKASLARILYNFRLQPVDYTRDIVFKLDILLRPSHSVRTKFIKIER